MRLDAVPQIRRHELFTPGRVLENVRMPPDHLARNGVHNVTEGEARLLGCHLRVIDDLQEEIAEFVLEPVEIAPRDSVCDLVSFLDCVGCDGGEALLHVPRTPGLGIAQARHDGEEFVDVMRFRSISSHGREKLE